MMGVCLHFQGNERGAQEQIERMLDRYIPPKQRSHIVRFQFEQRVTAHITFSQVIWLQGFVDRALLIVKNNIDEALSINHPLTLCNALAQSACPVALFVGNLAAAEHYIDLLLQQTSKHGFDFWHAYGRCFKGMLLNKRGNFETGIALLREAVDELRQARFVQYLTTFLGSLAESLANAGAIEQGLATIDEALARSEESEERWGLPELLRIKGAIILLTRKPTCEIDGEALFLAGMEKARDQNALFWELRCAMNICQLWRGQEKTLEARDLLASVLGKFTEGFDSSDLVAANALLEAA
jgi:predicted ATPase